MQVTVQACKCIFYSAGDLTRFSRSVILSRILQDAEYLKCFGTFSLNPLCACSTAYISIHEKSSPGEKKQGVCYLRAEIGCS